MQMLSKKDLSSGELDTLKRFRIPTTAVTANGVVQTNEEAQVYVHDLPVQLLEDTPAVLSLGKLCKDHGYTYEWPSGREPRLTKKREAHLLQNRERRSFGSSRIIIEFHHNFILDIASTGNSRSNEEATENCSEEVAGNRNEGIPEWPEDFTEKLEIAEIPATADISHGGRRIACTRTNFSGLRFGTSQKSGIKEA